MKRLPLVVAVGVLLFAVAISGIGSGAGSPGASSSARGSAVAAGSNAASAPPTVPVPTPSAPDNQPSASPAVPIEGPPADVPIVPVAQYRTTVEQIGRADVQAALAGTSKTWDGLELVATEAEAILAGIGVDRPAGDAHLGLAADAATLAADLASHRKRLGVLRADAVGPSVRALGWGNRRLFGVDAVATVADWGLTARLPQPVDTPVFDPAGSWTLVAGGDIMLDRGVAQTVTIRGKGADFPFDGGTAEITSRCKDCSPLGWDLPRTRRTGNPGALRHLVSSADIAIANFENPAPDRFSYHTSGLRFSADPKLIAGLANAGIDWVGLANNHIGDAGANGILQTIANLRQRGIAASGAGKNIAAARKPSILEAGGTKVAFLAYDTIRRDYTASPDRAGSARLSAGVVKADVAAARKAGAQVVIVFPHWGTEYDPTPFRGQQTLARAALDAGADMVIGNHAHWAGAMEVYKGKPIWYALGNFVFDQTWSEPTMEGITLELTFRGPTLVQARMRPHIILDKAQPNFLDPAGDGRVVMGQVFDASKGMLPW
ncbi:MAG TPA: CapA family protein [Candidatus Limnocylindrales bacterium]|nr:CapA family protein [Candidatus Limnocylindrales bacterium]